MLRIQRTRKKGHRLPPNTLVVTRGTKFGNDVGKGLANDKAVIAFTDWFYAEEQRQFRLDFAQTCRDRNIQNIACWCDLADMCHGDVLVNYWLYDSECYGFRHPK